MDERNHDMIHTFTQHIDNMFNPLIKNTNKSYQPLTHQMGRVVDFFGAPPVPPTPVPNVPRGANPPENKIAKNNQGLEGLDMVLVQGIKMLTKS